MNSQRKQIIFLAVMGVALAAVLVYQLGIKGTSGPAGATPAGATPAKTAPAAAATTAAAAAPGAPASSGSAEPAEIDIDALLASIKEVDFDYEQERVPRDVMEPLVGRVAVRTENQGSGGPVAPATLGKIISKVVSGIVWDESFPVAVVDNEVVEPGYEYADGTIVESIQEDHVVFRFGESLIQVELKER